jgi:hypothetical protein
MVEHSTLPWELSPQGYILPTHKSPVAMLKLKSPWIEGAWDDDPEAAANAAFIVDAVNNHELLKQKLEFAEFEWNRATEGMKERDERIQALETELEGCRACRAKVDCISR